MKLNFKWIHRLHPVHYPAVFTILALFGIGILGGIIARLAGIPEYRLFFTAPLTVGLAFAFRRPRQMLLTTKFRWASLRYYWLPLGLLACMPLLTGGYDFSRVDSVVFWNMMGIGIFEEVLIHGIFMGLVLAKWGASKKTLKRASVIGAFIFGLLHLNAILEDPTDMHLVHWKVATVIFATFLSVGFAGLAWQSQSIWGVAIVHGLIDVFANVGSPEMLMYIYGSWDWRCTLVSVLYCFPMLVYGLWLLNKEPASD